MIALPRNIDPLPAAPLGQRLCELFGNYRWSFIHTEAPPDANAKPQWKTERRYPIKSRVLWQQWQDANQLIGVRFNTTTAYALLDIDAQSPYHPQHNAESLAIIQAALETIGITRTLLIRSSWSGGLHLYIPLPEPLNTFNLAVALKNCLEAQGFQLKSGHLEIFPNDKAYGVATTIEYKAHRLPLQPGSGSYLLDDDLHLVSNQLSDFFPAWDSAAAGQDLATLQSALTIARENRHKRPKPRRLNNVEAWRADLETTLADGWTGHGQTNHLLKEIGCYGVVFKNLSGEALVDYIHQQAIASPGYQQWCRHQYQIQMRARVWAKAVENYYWPIGTHPKPRPDLSNNIVPFNQQRAEAAQERVRAAVAQLEAENQLPEQTTQRAISISKLAHTSLNTLYQYKELWHPHHQQAEEMPVIAQPTKDAAPSATPQPAKLKPLKCLPDKELHTKEEIMKCKAAQLELSFQKEIKSTSTGGVRGGDSRSPQVEPLSLVPDLLPTVARGQQVLGQASYDFGINEDLDAIIQAIQVRVRSLGWSMEQASEFIAERFDGRRRSQLSDDELILLLYYLQDLELSSSHEGGEVSGWPESSI
ncbi:MAG: hypothetical protein AAGF01_12550 [Cyanobacteria bacterium P01_G01_bin.38]